MNRIHAWTLPSLLAAGVGLASAPSFAQDQKAADVLLLIDTSGSMGLTTVRDPGMPSQYAVPKCGEFPAYSSVDLNEKSMSAAASPPDRWSTLVNVLTGSVKGLACSSQNRSSAMFRGEFALGGTTPGIGSDPYDYHYHRAINRIVATNGASACTPAPSWDEDIRKKLLDNAYDWPSSASGGPIYWRDITKAYSEQAACPFTPQVDNGLMDEYKDIVRFGLMTFDTLPNWTVGGVPIVGTGLASGSNQPNYPAGIGDTWSYFTGWMNSTTGVGTGWPGGCAATGGGLFEVGARNPAAPPWEGRLMDFGDPAGGSSDIIARNERVQSALLAMRPYGATPIAAMLEDAAHFMLGDTTNGTPYYGAANDPGFSSIPCQDTCRKRFVILVTDGGPNLDLRPSCEANIGDVQGKCPYRRPAEVAEALANSNVGVYVVGFAVSNPTDSGGALTCTDLLDPVENPNACQALSDCSGCAANRCTYGYCVNDSDQELLATCCTLKEIADRGRMACQDPPLPNLFFAEDADGLKASIAQILKTTVPKGEANVPSVFSSGDANVTTGMEEMRGAHLFASFDPGDPIDLWAGNLNRQRFKCDTDINGGPPKPVLVDIDPARGDKFGVNLQSELSLSSRNVFAAVPEPDSSGKHRSLKSIRPFLKGTADSLVSFGVDSDSDADNMVSGKPAEFISRVKAGAMFDERDAWAPCLASGCCFTTTIYPNPDAATCRTRTLRLELGLSAGDATIGYSRKSALGGVRFAAPVLVTRPNSFLRDESYLGYQRNFAARPPVVYAATVDGQLHAFAMNSLDAGLNELWTFIPPAMLPKIPDLFPTADRAKASVMLDGPLVASEVPGRTETDLATGRFLFRTRDDARAGSTATTKWHSVLVGSFGVSSGFYALDVSWPQTDTDDVPVGYHKGPRFLWQLTTDEQGNPLFGESPGAPAIATLFYSDEVDEPPREHAVAILPGGYGGARTTTYENVSFTEHGMKDTGFTPRATTARWDPISTGIDKQMQLGGARSMTVVRLDTGEVVRTFRASGTYDTGSDDRKKYLAPKALYDALRVTEAPFDAPITGNVIVYPSGPGAVADRAYVGDAEGRVWRMDFSSANPEHWNARMMFDAYPSSGGDLAYGPADSEPIETPIIVSTDPIGRVTLALSTGEQRELSREGKHIVWSLTEFLHADGVKAAPNWYMNADNTTGFDNGERVTGPMALFDSKLYFTTYLVPDDRNALECKLGNVTLWGVHYIDTDPADPMDVVPGNSAPENGPSPQWPDPTDPLSKRVPALDLGATKAFGVGLIQQPTCYGTDEVPADGFFGFGAHQSITGITPGKFELVVQTGGDSVGSDIGAGTNVKRIELADPAGRSIIDSWAAIVE